MCRYAVVDLEMCNVPKWLRSKKYPYGKETIQIGAVLLDEEFRIVDEFVTYVSPQTGSLDAEIQKLTGIKNSNLYGAPLMEKALRDFMMWLPEDTKVVSWSMNDRAQIAHEVEARKLEIPGMEEVLGNWIDCQKTFGEKMGTARCYRLSEALVAADIVYEDGAHDGLVDAYNTALLFAKMEKDPEFRLNVYYEKAMTGEESTPATTLGSLFAGIDFQGLKFA